jgi:hypothetical protein
MPSYSGLVVGGPLDGQYVEHTSNMYRLPQEGETIYRADGTEAHYQPNKWFTYLFISRYWVPYDVKKGARSLNSILDEMDALYAATKGKRDE